MLAPTILTEHEVTMAEAAVLLRELTDAGAAVMLWGPPGIGKSAIVFQMGEATDRKVIEYRANLREPVDVRGIPVPDLKSGSTKWLVPDELPQEKRDGKRGILFLDEINTASPQMMAVLFGLVLDRRVGDYVLPDGWVIVAAGNRVSDRAAAQRMPTALRNRFAHLFCKPDLPAFCLWANANGVSPELVAFLRFREAAGDGLLHRMPRGDENTFPSPRSNVAAAKHVNASDKLRLRLFAAHIGDGPAAEFDGFIGIYRSIGTLDDVANNPDTAPIPTEPSLQYAVCTGLARMATKKNFANIMKYAQRLNREKEMLLVTDATNRDESLKNTSCYGEWAVANADLIVQ
jgi:hypothetical protein